MSIPGVLNWILMRAIFLMMMSRLGVQLTWLTILILLGTLAVIVMLVSDATAAVQHMMMNPHPLQNPLNLAMIIDLATLMLSMTAAIITLRVTTAYLLEVNR